MLRKKRLQQKTVFIDIKVYFVKYLHNTKNLIFYILSPLSKNIRNMHSSRSNQISLFLHTNDKEA